ncbi:transient receptor potential channel pyrexia-like [Macrobrachium nipponense]|uniref:transient receptor potential channel pyrexia-like n=1 Tax=Macrobrachium nipponense TaxID=159736 RepID=UPI0030C84F50
MSDKVHFVNEAYIEMDKVAPDGSADQECAAAPVIVTETKSQATLRLLFSAINSGKFAEVEKRLHEAAGLINSTDYCGLTPLHSACHMKQFDILKLLISRGARVNVHDSLGETALHVAVREKWHDGVRELLQRGASPDETSHPPSNFKNKTKESPLHMAVKIGDRISTSQMLKCQPDLNIRDGDNQTVFHLAASHRNVSILKELLTDINLPEYMRNLDENGHSIYHAALSNTSGSFSESQTLKAIRYIYTFHKNLDEANIFGETPLIKACHLGLSDVVDFFISNGANPTKVTFQSHSAIHAACISGNPDVLQHLLNSGRVGHLITSIDKYGNHPFYYAIESSSPECCKLLLENGEHLVNVYKNEVSNFTLVKRYLPTALQLFRDLFNSSIKLSNKPKHHPDYSITFDYSSLVSSNKRNIQSSIISEMAGTPLETLIMHPLVESFLHIKWCRIRGAFYLKVFQYFIYLMIHSVFIMMTFGTTPKDWSTDPFSLMIFRILHGTFLVIVALPEIVMTIANFKRYLTHWETYTKVAALACSIFVVCTVSGKIVDDVTLNKVDARLSPKRMFASLSIVLGWIELMMLLGRFPTLGAYILMVTKVGKSIFKFLFAFLSVLIGFTLGFHVLFQRLPIFADFNLGFVKVLMMLKGEISYSQFVDRKGSPFNIYPQILMSVFLFLVVIIMGNLLTGLAVKGVPDLRRQGKIKRLIKQLSYLVAFEKLIAFTYKIKCFPQALLSLLSSRLTVDTKITIFPNKEFRKHKFMRTIPEKIISEAITLGSCKEPEDFPEEADDDVVEQLQSFKKRYTTDRRNQSHMIKELSEMCGDIKKQMTELSQQIQEQILQNQNLYNKLVGKHSA